MQSFFKKTRRYYSTVPVAASHCSYCGSKYSSAKWPKLCNCCNNTVFRNPIPVAVGLIPITDNDDKVGLLLVQRAIKPCIGELCLPGGFIDWGESWQEAASREVFEETSLQTDPNEFNLFDTHSTPDKTRILIFGYSKKIRHIKELETFKPTNETSSIKVGLLSDKLCFSLHQEVFNEWFNQQKIEKLFYKWFNRE